MDAAAARRLRQEVDSVSSGSYHLAGNVRSRPLASILIAVRSVSSSSAASPPKAALVVFGKKGQPFYYPFFRTRYYRAL
jgi:hypothetical protein